MSRLLRNEESGPVRLLLTDNPWEYGDRKAFRKDNPEQATRLGIGLDHRYSAGTMSEADLCAMGPNVRKLTTLDCYAPTWVTGPHLQTCFSVMDAWGFTYSCPLFVWVKESEGGKILFLPGTYTGSNVELCLLFRRNPKRFKCWHSTAKGSYKPSQIIKCPQPKHLVWNEAKQRDEMKIIHSRKPEEAHIRLEKWLLPHLQPEHEMMELFATQHRPGWITLGHKLTGTDIRQDLDNYASATPNELEAMFADFHERQELASAG